MLLLWLLLMMLIHQNSLQLKIIHVHVLVVGGLISLLELLFQQHLVLFGSQQIYDALRANAAIIEIDAHNWIQILVAVKQQQCLAFVVVAVVAAARVVE